MRPAIIYGCECWTIKKAQEQKLHSYRDEDVEVGWRSNSLRQSPQRVSMCEGSKLLLWCWVREEAAHLDVHIIMFNKLCLKVICYSVPNYFTFRLMSLISLLNDSPDELLYGKSGYLYALLFVNKHIYGKEAIPTSHIEKVLLIFLRNLWSSNFDPNICLIEVLLFR